MAKFKTRSGIVHYVSEDMSKLFITTSGSFSMPDGTWMRKLKTECLKIFGREVYEQERRQFEAEYRYDSDLRPNADLLELEEKIRKDKEENEYRKKHNLVGIIDTNNHVNYKIYSQELITSGVLKCGSRYFIYKAGVFRGSVDWEIQMTPAQQEARRSSTSMCTPGTALHSINKCFADMMWRGFEFENPDNLPMVLPEGYVPPKVNILKPFMVQDKVLDRMLNIAELAALNENDEPDKEDISRIYRLLNAVKMGKEIRVIHTKQETAK